MKIRIFLALLSVIGGVLLTASSCPEKTINKDDSTPPEISFSVRVGEDPAIEITDDYDREIGVFYGKTFSASCKATDPDGMKSIRIHFSKKTAEWCVSLVGDKEKPGEFSLGLPAEDLVNDAKVLPGNKVTTTLVMLTEKIGPFYCNLTDSEIGSLAGEPFEIYCTGENHSNKPNANAAQKIATIRIVGKTVPID